MNCGFLTWLTSYLCDRFQRIQANGVVGPLISVPSGVPQGSVLGPYLFALFIATLEVRSPNARLVKYTDDLTLIETCTVDCPNPDHVRIVEAWTDAYKMQLNHSKCHQMLINRTKQSNIKPNEAFETVPNVNVLGVTLNNNLSWDNHFERVILNASRRLYTLRALKPYISKKKLVEVYNCSILSILLYASPVFCKLPILVSCKLDRLRKRAHRIICDNECTCSILPDISTFRDKLACDFLRKCNDVKHPLHLRVPQKMKRSGKYCLPFSSTSRRLNSFFPWTCMLANGDTSIL